PNVSGVDLVRDHNWIQQTNNENFSQVKDPHIQSELQALNPVPASKLNSVASRWQALDTYTAQKAYIAALGQEMQPMFFSNRINFATAIFHPLYGNDFSSIELK